MPMRQLQTQPASDRLALTVEDLARQLACSTRSIWKWTAEGKFPQPIRLAGSRAVRWLRADIEAYLTAQKAVQQ